MAKRLTIPQIRDELHEHADQIAQIGNKKIARRIHFLAEETKRRKPLYPRAAPRWPRLTEAENVKVRRYKAKHPRTSQRTMARIFKTGEGRISEAIAGHRDD